MKLMTEEKEILTSANQQVTLTTHRVRSKYKQGGDTYITSIMLEELCSCQCVHKSNTLLLWVGLLFLVASIAVGITVEVWGYSGILFALIFTLAYLLGRTGCITLSSLKAQITLGATRMSVEEMTEFIDAVESAKNDRYLKLNRTI